VVQRRAVCSALGRGFQSGGGSVVCQFLQPVLINYDDASASGINDTGPARERLVLILHVAYLFVPLGFLLLGMSAFGFIGPSAGLHAWMAGAVGTMTLAIMTRASLGPTGHSLSAGVGTQAIYATVIFAACLRIGASLLPAGAVPMLHTAGLAWSAAFIGFALLYGPLLFRSRAR
jgi:uncharacterized protein involved in response to NO